MLNPFVDRRTERRRSRKIDLTDDRQQRVPIEVQPGPDAGEQSSLVRAYDGRDPSAVASVYFK